MMTYLLINQILYLFIKNINLQKHFTLPRWLIPIVDNKKRIYVDKEQDDIESNNNTNVKHFEDELIEKNTLISSLAEKTGDSNHYKKMMEIIFSDIFIPFKNNDKVLIPYHGNYLRDCR